MKSCVVGFVILLIIRTAVAADLPPTFDVNRAEDLARITSECREFILSNSQLVKLMDMNAVTIDEVCSCQAPWFISSLDDNTLYALRFGNEPLSGIYPIFREMVVQCALNLID